MKTKIRSVVSKHSEIDKTNNYETSELLLQVAEATYEEVMKMELKNLK